MIAVEFTLMIVTRTNFGFGGNNENIVLVDFEFELETISFFFLWLPIDATSDLLFSSSYFLQQQIKKVNNR